MILFHFFAWDSAVVNESWYYLVIVEIEPEEFLMLTVEIISPGTEWTKARQITSQELNM